MVHELQLQPRPRLQTLSRCRLLQPFIIVLGDKYKDIRVIQKPPGQKYFDNLTYCATDPRNSHGRRRPVRAADTRGYGGVPLTFNSCFDIHAVPAFYLENSSPLMQALVDGAVDTQMAAFLVLLRAKVGHH